MKYLEFKENVKTGDTVAVYRFPHSDLLGLIVKMVTGDSRVHTAFAFTQEDNVFLAEMDGKKNVIVPLSQYSNAKLEVYSPPVQATHHEFRSAMWELLGERRDYSWSDIFWLGFSIVFRTMRWAPKVENVGSMTCTEFNEHIYRKLGWQPPFGGYVAWPSKFCDALGAPKAVYDPAEDS